jgi:hypothetical protein
VVYSIYGGELKRDFVLFPGGKPESIEFSYSCSVGLVNGGLTITSLGIQLREHPPVCYQNQTRIEGSFRLEKGIIRFLVGNYCLVEPLVIDPLLSFSSFLGGNGEDSALSITTENSYLYVGGSTTSTDISGFEVLTGSSEEAFLCQIALNSKDVQYCSYFSGNGFDQLNSLSVENGVVYASMVSSSTSFLNKTNKGSSDVFVGWIDSSTGKLLSSASIGGGAYDAPTRLVVDNGEVVVVGQTSSSDFPEVAPWGLSGASSDGFVVRFSTTGVLLMANRIGGPLTDSTNYVSVLSTNSYLLGGVSVTSTGTAEGYRTIVTNGVPSKISIAGLGGGSTTAVEFIHVINGDQLVIVGSTTATDLPVTFDAQQKLSGGGADCFFARTNGEAITYLSYFGGSGEDLCTRIEKVNLQYVVVGTTSSMDLPVSSDAIQREHQGQKDCFVFTLDENNRLTYATYFGGTSQESFGSLAVFGELVILVGTSQSPDFPLKNAFRNTFEQTEAFVSIIGYFLMIFPHSLHPFMLLTAAIP